MFLTKCILFLVLVPTAFAASPLFPRQLRDASGNLLIISAPPQRIVSQTLGTDEILLAICPPHKIAAISSLALDERYSNIVEQARSMTVASNVEQILKLQPDLILVASYNRAETVELLQATGAPVFRLANFRSLENIKNNIRTIGLAIGEEHRAELLVAQIEGELRAILTRIPKRNPPLTVMSYSLGNYTAGAHTTFDDLVKWVGAVNVAAQHGIEEHAKISDEQILAWQPEVIVTHAAPHEFAKARKQLLDNPAIAASRAGQSGKILVIDNRYLFAVSQNIVLGVKALAEGLDH